MIATFNNNPRFETSCTRVIRCPLYMYSQDQFPLPILPCPAFLCAPRYADWPVLKPRDRRQHRVYGTHSVLVHNSVFAHTHFPLELIGLTRGQPEESGKCPLGQKRGRSSRSHKQSFVRPACGVPCEGHRSPPGKNPRSQSRVYIHQYHVHEVCIVENDRRSVCRHPAWHRMCVWSTVVVSLCVLSVGACVLGVVCALW